MKISQWPLRQREYERRKKKTLRIDIYIIYVIYRVVCFSGLEFESEHHKSD